jgi:hypothetical protein
MLDRPSERFAKNVPLRTLKFFQEVMFSCAATSGLVLAAVVAVLSPSFVARQEQAPQQLKSDQWVQIVYLTL